jgi:hypothetical protein
MGIECRRILRRCAVGALQGVVGNHSLPKPSSLAVGVVWICALVSGLSVPLWTPDRTVFAGLLALSPRRHGSGRLHRPAQTLPAGSKHIMTQDRHSTRTKQTRPPERSGEVMAARASRVPEQRLNAQIQLVLIARRTRCCGKLRLTGSPGMPFRIGRGSQG